MITFTRSPRLAALTSCFTLVLALLTGCGGGSSGGSDSSASAVNLPPSAASPTDSNVAVVTVEQGPGNNVNIPYVTVTLCIPGTSTCKSIDHVLLDTGSTGLRIFDSNLSASPALSLPAYSIGSSSTISECAQFLNSVAWGSIKTADVSIGNKKASSVAVQVMNPNMPAGLTSACSTAPVMVAPGTAASASQTALSANGILGVSLFSYDGQVYFNCASPTLACRIGPLASQQVQNPVTQFSSDNNGVLVQLPAIPANGSNSAQGYLIFGVGTQSNNTLGSANVVPTDPSGFFTTTYKGTTLSTSFIDSGSNGLFFNDSSIATTSSGFYAPASSLSLSALLGGTTVNFTIANANTLFLGNSYAFNNLGGTLTSGYFDWGLPFFFGRSVYTVVEGKTVGTHTGPFYAFTN